MTSDDTRLERLLAAALQSEVPTGLLERVLAAAQPPQARAEPADGAFWWLASLLLAAAFIACERWGPAVEPRALAAAARSLLSGPDWRAWLPDLGPAVAQAELVSYAWLAGTLFIPAALLFAERFRTGLDPRRDSHG